MAVALADKLDTLVGFWAIDEKPTGSKDPYALRRAALGVVRLVLENKLKVPLNRNLELALAKVGASIAILRVQKITSDAVGVLPEMVATHGMADVSEILKRVANPAGIALEITNNLTDLLAFFADRLKVYLRDKGARHDLIDAVFALPGQDDLLMIVTRVNALAAFLDTDDGKNLLAGYKRAANILRAEEKKDGAGAFAQAHAKTLLSQPEEIHLAAAIAHARTTVAASIACEDFAAAMQALAALRAPVDAFFDKVTVNDSAPEIRRNRLKLLNELREAMGQVADFGKVSG